MVQVIFSMAQPGDEASIYQLLQDMVIEEDVADRFTLTQARLAEALFSAVPVAECLLAITDNQIVGLALYSTTNRNFDLFESSGLYLHDLYIVQAHRRQGIATQLMQKLKDIAQERHYSRIDWVVLKNNKLGRNFYHSLAEAKEVDYIHTMRIKVTHHA